MIRRLQQIKLRLERDVIIRRATRTTRRARTNTRYLKFTRACARVARHAAQRKRIKRIVLLEGDEGLEGSMTIIYSGNIIARLCIVLARSRFLPEGIVIRTWYLMCIAAGEARRKLPRPESFSLAFACSVSVPPPPPLGSFSFLLLRFRTLLPRFMATFTRNL